MKRNEYVVFMISVKVENNNINIIKLLLIILIYNILWQVWMHFCPHDNIKYTQG